MADENSGVADMLQGIELSLYDISHSLGLVENVDTGPIVSALCAIEDTLATINGNLSRIADHLENSSL